MVRQIWGYDPFWNRNTADFSVVDLVPLLRWAHRPTYRKHWTFRFPAAKVADEPNQVIRRGETKGR